MAIGILGLVGAAFLLLPLLSFLRTLQVGRDLNELCRRLDSLERRIDNAEPLPRPTAEPVPPMSARPARSAAPPVVSASPPAAAAALPGWARAEQPDLVAAIASHATDLDLEERI